MNSDISCVISGAAGLGIQTVEEFLCGMLRRAGFHVFASREYMSRVRGGNNSTEIRIGTNDVRAFSERIDFLFPLTPGVRTNIRRRLGSGTTIVADAGIFGDEFVETGVTFVNVPLEDMTKELGGKVYANMAVAGIVLGLVGIPIQEILDEIGRFFGDRADIVGKNADACSRGYRFGEKLRNDSTPVLRKTGASPAHRILLDGSDAVALGAVAGGCSFVAGYPMSPATGVLTFLSTHSERFHVVVEQVEDEPSAIYMAVGAAYAGARPLVTTSGGGFALMAEGISLAGIMEAPVVVHLSQRPGPATGMATRTEQADLELALYSGHGEFPRAIFAPGSVETAFSLTARAFDIAERYQTPVIVLTDQYLMNTLYDVAIPDMSLLSSVGRIEPTRPEYKRYAPGADGISPRGVPGYGEGLVGADSHEHDAEAHISEDVDVRVAMNAKRLGKLDGLRKESIPPMLYGPKDYGTLLVCFGSTREIAREAIDLLGRSDTAVLSFEQVYPLHEAAGAFLAAAKRVVVLEGNATGQFRRLLRATFGVEARHSILKSDGFQFSVEETVRRLSAILEGGDGA
jgi:2-oxoglutarate ferredoxin oxidoreductase subunit alpha